MQSEPRKLTNQILRFLRPENYSVLISGGEKGPFRNAGTRNQVRNVVLLEAFQCTTKNTKGFQEKVRCQTQTSMMEERRRRKSERLRKY